MFYVVYTPMQIVGGIAADKFSPERLIKIGLIGGAISNTVIFFFNTSYPVMMAAWIFNAIVQFGLWPSVFKIVSSQCVRSERPKMLFLISLSASAGHIFSYGLGALLTDWRMNFSISAILLLGFAVALLIYERHIDKYMRWDNTEPSKLASQDCSKKVSTLTLFWSSGFILLLLVLFLRDSFATIVRRIAATMLNETFDIGASLGTLMSMLIVATSAVGFFIVREMLQHKIIKNYIKGMIFGLLLSSIAAVLFILSKGIAANVVSMCLMVGIATATDLFTNSISSMFSKYGKNATAAGLANAARACGYVAPFVAVVIQERSDWYTVKLLLLGVIISGALVSIAILPIYNRFKKREAEEEKAKEESKSAV